MSRPRPQTFRIARIFSCAAIAALALSASATASARANGISGRSGKTPGTDCTNCHNGGTAPTVAFMGPATLAPNAVGTYTFRVTTAAQVTGSNIAVSDGAGATLTAGTNTKLLNGEITHNTPVQPTNGATDFTFTLKAGPNPGTITLFGAGNAGNGDNLSGGDAPALMQQTITVAAPVVVQDAGAQPAPVTPTDPDAAAAPAGQTTPNAVGGPAGNAPGATTGDGGSQPFYLQGASNSENPEFADTGLACSAAPGTARNIAPAFLVGIALLASMRRRGRR